MVEGGGEGWCSETKTGWWRGEGHGVPSLTLCFFEVVPLRWTDRVVYWHENARLFDRLFDRNYLPVCSSPRLCVPTHALHCARVCRGDLAALCMHVAGVCELPWPNLRSPVCLVSDAAQCAVSPVCWAGVQLTVSLNNNIQVHSDVSIVLFRCGYIGCRVYGI